MKSVKAFIVEDERLAREKFFSMLEKFEEIQIVGEADNIKTAASLIETLNPDILFLDIELGGESGFSLLEHIDPKIKIIFVTAYDKYAIRAFEVNAVDYLLKPVKQKRLDETIKRITGDQTKEDENKKLFKYDDYIFISESSKSGFIKISDIVCITASTPYSNFTTINKKNVLVLKPLKEWEERLPASAFVRVHRNSIINMNYVEEAEKWFNYTFRLHLKHLNDPVLVSRRYSKKLKSML